MNLPAPIEKSVANWLADPAITDADKLEIRRLADAGAEKELTDRFHRELEFGTGGLRGILGAGLNRMNRYTVGAAAEGLARYIRKALPAVTSPAIAIAYDCRRFSEAFAHRVAEIMAASGIASHLFPAPRPTPQLSYAIRHLHCAAGVVITASHNPPEYNGLKAYWSDGAQVVPPHDAGIIREVRGVGAFTNIRAMPFDDARRAGLIHVLDCQIDDTFLRDVQATCLAPDICVKHGRDLKIVFTALHGTGGTLAPAALRNRGFQQVIEVSEQADLNGEFPSVQSPNPEEPAALKLAIEKARAVHADLVIGTDPDADRVGIAVPNHNGEFVLLTGNQTAALLTDYLCRQQSAAGALGQRPVVLTTIVTGDLMKTIARSYGVEVVETLTGFKWIAEQIRLYGEAGTPQQPTRRFVFGAEESYGYLPAAFVRDKDAITSAAVIAEMAAVARDQGTTLYDQLEALYLRHGYHQEGAKSLTLPGADGQKKIAALMARLRSQPPVSLGGIAVASIGDVSTGEIRDAKTGHRTDSYDLPRSDVLVFTLTDGTKVIARPSGTEPKIKFYILVKESGANLAAARTVALSKIKIISDELQMIANT